MTPDDLRAPKPSCLVCVYCLRQDYGYSNWTVEGTTMFCLRGLNPSLDDSEVPWSQPSKALAEALDVALTCPSYRHGAPAHLDVDREGIPYENPQPSDYMDYAEDAEVAQLMWNHFHGGRNADG